MLPEAGLYLTSFLCGAGVMILEILGFRLLPPYFGYSIHVWGSLLGVIMVALAIGYSVGGVLADRRPHPRMLYLMILTAAGYNFLLVFAHSSMLGFAVQFDLIAGSLLATFLLFAIPMTALSAVSPFIIRLLAVKGRLGATAGNIYATSTMGSIAGTFLASFYLIPTIGTRASLVVSFVTLTLLAATGLLTCGAPGSGRAARDPTLS